MRSQTDASRLKIPSNKVNCCLSKNKCNTPLLRYMIRRTRFIVLAEKKMKKINNVYLCMCGDGALDVSSLKINMRDIIIIIIKYCKDGLLYNNAQCNVRGLVDKIFYGT